MTTNSKYAMLLLMGRIQCLYHFILRVLTPFYQVVLRWTALFPQLKKKAMGQSD
jgi:hypothetical protein